MSRHLSMGLQAQEHLTTALMMYREMDMAFWVEQGTVEVTALA